MKVCVLTTATYGDRFRCLCRWTAEKSGPENCTLRVEYTLVYIASVNKFIKSCIEKGAGSGLAKNFDTSVTVLNDFVPLENNLKKPPAPVKRVESAPQLPAVRLLASVFGIQILSLCVGFLYLLGCCDGDQC